MIDLTAITTLFEEIEERRKQDEYKRKEVLALLFEEFGEPHIAKIIRERGLPKIAYIHTSHQGLIQAMRLICEVTEVKYKGSSPEVMSLSWGKTREFHALCISKGLDELRRIERRYPSRKI